MPGPNSTSTADADAGLSLEPSRIPQTAFLASILALYGVALVAGATRTVSRWCRHRAITPSDYFMVAACVVLTGSIGYTLSNRGSIYESAADESISTTLTHQLSTIGQLLPWIVIYCAKFGFLMEFWTLARRMRIYEIYWWIATVTVGLSSAAAVALCVYDGVYEAQIDTGAGANPINHIRPIYTGVSISLDAISNIVIVGIPIRLLWKTQARPLSKLILGLILSLSTAMIVIAIIRAALAQVPNSKPATTGNERTKQDLVWLLFWQVVEAEAAVIMLSLTLSGAFTHDGQLMRAVGGRREQEGIDAAEAGAAAGLVQGSICQKRRRRNDASPQEMSINIPIPAEPEQLADSEESTYEPPQREADEATGPWLRPKTSRGKLVRKASETSMGKSRSTKRTRQQQLEGHPTRALSSSHDKSNKKQRPKLNKFPSADDVGSSSLPTSPRDRRWPRTPRILQANRSPHFGSPRHRSLERSASGRRLIDPDPQNNPPDVIDLTMDFAAAVWAAPPTPDSMMSGRRKGKKSKRGKNKTAEGPASPLSDTRNEYFDEDDEELMRQEELRQEEEDRRRWLLLQRKYENEKPLPPPVARPPGRILQMDALHKPRPESKQPPHRASKMPGGLF